MSTLCSVQPGDLIHLSSAHLWMRLCCVKREHSSHCIYYERSLTSPDLLSSPLLFCSPYVFSLLFSPLSCFLAFLISCLLSSLILFFLSSRLSFFLAARVFISLLCALFFSLFLSPLVSSLFASPLCSPLLPFSPLFLICPSRMQRLSQHVRVRRRSTRAFV